MTWVIIGTSALIAFTFSLLMIKLGVGLGLVCLSAPTIAVASVFTALRFKYTLFELGPFIVVPFFLAWVFSLIIALVICWLSIRRSL